MNVTRILSTLTLIIALVPLSAFSAGEIVRDYPVSRVGDSTYVIIGPMGYPSVENQGFMNNPAWIVTEGGVIVIDPGSSLQAGRMLMKHIAETTDRPVTHVFVTHVHGDHWLGNHGITERYPDAVIMAHPEMIRRAHDGEAAHWVSLMSAATEGFTDGTEAVIPRQAVDGSDTLQIHGATFRIYAPGKAHSGTDIMIEYVDESVLFTGDNVLYQRIARMDDGTFSGNIDACQLAVDIAARHYVPGHGPLGGIEVPESFLTYLQTLYGEVERLYEEGLQAFEMKDSVVEKLAAYEDWVNFDDEVGRHISLALLEAEQNAF